MTRGFGRADPAEYGELPLHAHELLADVPLHDVWQVELPDGGAEVTLDDVRPLLSAEELQSLNAGVRGLFALRSALGKLFGWDDAAPRAQPHPRSYLTRVPAEHLQRSREKPGTRDGPFTLLYAHASEAVSEVINDTVHAFSVLALAPQPGGHRLFWAIHVAPVGRITGLYMRLIDPFRHHVVYPAVLQHVHAAWLARP